MEFWVFTCSDSPLEHWLEGFKQRFDAWEAGGVRGIVVGRMQFLHLCSRSKGVRRLWRGGARGGAARPGKGEEAAGDDG